MSQEHIQKKSPPDKLSKHQVDCYVKWLQLKASKEYHEASKEIRQLQKASDRYNAAHTAYLPFLDPSVPDSTEKEIRRQEYWAAEESNRKAQEALSSREDEMCKKFGLDQWWDPDDKTITIENSQYLFNYSYAVEVLDPAPDKKVDWFTKVRKEGSRTLEREGAFEEPSHRYTQADDEGWLTLRVNLNAPLEEVEKAIHWHLRVNRENPPKTRNRPDKNAAALETWVCYEQEKLYSTVSKRLKRPVSTVKGQYVRACVLIYGQKPSGSIKQRRAGIFRDPASEFQDHYGSCNRCQKANAAGEMCSRFLAFVNQ